MLTPEEHMEVTARRKRGWSISAIARHVGHDNKTVRTYLNGERQPGVRQKTTGDPVRPVRTLCSPAVQR